MTTDWQPMSSAPKHTEKFDAPVEFLASRKGRVIICWWNDDRHARKPRPYWDGTDGHHNVDFCRKTKPDGWMPGPKAIERNLT